MTQEERWLTKYNEVMEFLGGTEGQVLFQIEYEQLDNKEVKECLGKLENHQELVYIT